jgi:4-oxalmesaconate hydratase
MIIDCHGHYTTEPSALVEYRKHELESLAKDPNYKPKAADFAIDEHEMREKLETAQLRFQRERGTDLTIFSPRAVGMGHHLGTEQTGYYWAEICNNMVRRVCDMYPENFVPVCQLPQYPGVPPKNCIPELERCVNEMGFIGVNVNPDPSGAMWSDPPITDKDWWYPLWEKIEELQVPAMLHVSGSCNPNFHHTGAHYIAGDTTVFMQLILGDLFKDFPSLKFIIPHGGGAVPFHWGRYRGLAQDMGKPTLDEHLLNNVYFDTCVYHQPGIDCMTKVIPTKNILFASEMVGAVRGIDPETGFHYDDTKRYIDGADLTVGQRKQIFEENTRKVFPRLDRIYPPKG